MYASFECLIFPSRWAEPFALTPLEAAAAGRVIVGTTTGGSGEFLKNGQNALTFEANNVASLQENLLLLQRHPRFAHLLALQAQKKVAAQFTVDHSTRAIERLLHQAVMAQQQPLAVNQAHASEEVAHVA